MRDRAFYLARDAIGSLASAATENNQSTSWVVRSRSVCLARAGRSSTAGHGPRRNRGDCPATLLCPHCSRR